MNGKRKCCDYLLTQLDGMCKLMRDTLLPSRIIGMNMLCASMDLGARFLTENESGVFRIFVIPMNLQVFTSR